MGGGGALEWKTHFAKWEVVCSDKSKVGLGVGCLSTLNRALLGKWSWRLMVEREALWKQDISRKYGVEEGGYGRRLGRKVLC